MVCGVVIVTRLRKTLEGTELQRNLGLTRRLSDAPDPLALISLLPSLATRNITLLYYRVENFPRHQALPIQPRTLYYIAS